jgi:acetyl esterase/lipase
MVGFTAGEAGFEPPEPYPGVSSAVSAVIDFYGGYDAMKFPLVQKQLAALTPDLAGVRPALEQINLFQPVTHLTPAVPPVLIVHGRDDSLIDFHQAIEMDHDLTAKGVPHELVLMDHVGHAFTFTTDGDHLLPRDLRPIILAFLRKYLGTANRSDPSFGHAD